MLGKKFLFGLFLIFAAIVLVVNTTIASWTIEKVAPKQVYPTAIAVDSNKRPHIAYGSNHLYYAYYDGSSWHSETVDSSSGVGYSVSIAVDSSGKAHISYYDGINEDIKIVY